MSALHPDWLDAPEIRTLIAAFDVKRAPLRFVGGAVRDSLLGIAAGDIDAATPLAPDAVMALLDEAEIKAVPTGIDHGTVTAVVQGKHFEITTLRKDIETFGRHARVEYTDDWKADAARRDFTINALYLSPQGELFDYFAGADDLKKGCVRFIGDPAARVKEDYLRILRFFRFHARFGKGAPDAAALAACAENAPRIAELSGERIQREMMKLLAMPQPSQALALMAGPVARYVFGFDAATGVLENLESIESEIAAAPDTALRLAALLVPAPKMAPLLARAWKLPNALSDDVQQILIMAQILSAELPVAERKKLLRRAGREIFRQSVLLRWAEEGTAAGGHYRPMLDFADSWLPPDFPLSGEDLKEIGMKEGKPLGDVLRHLEEIWEASDYMLTREDLLKKATA